MYDANNEALIPGKEYEGVWQSKKDTVTLPRSKRFVERKVDKWTEVTREGWHVKVICSKRCRGL